MSSMITRNKAKQINNIFNFLKKCKVSSENYNSTREPFFAKDGKNETFDINHEIIENIPDGINRNIKLIYDILGNTKKEIYVGEWVIMSLERALEIFTEYSNNNQKKFLI